MVRNRAWFLVLLVQMLKPLPQLCTDILSAGAVCKADHASCEIYVDFHLLQLWCPHCCNALIGLYYKVDIAGMDMGEWKWIRETKFGQICTTHVQKLLFPHFRSKFWHRRLICRSRFPIWYGYFGDRWTFPMWPWPLTFLPWTCLACCTAHWDNFHQVSTSQLIRSWPIIFSLLIC